MLVLIWCLPLRLTTKADWDSFESQEHYIAWSIRWISQASRVLKPTGSLVRLIGNLGGFEAPGFQILQALPLAELALQ
jgi:DNA modification methylase